METQKIKFLTVVPGSLVFKKGKLTGSLVAISGMRHTMDDPEKKRNMNVTA